MMNRTPAAMSLMDLQKHLRKLMIRPKRVVRGRQSAASEVLLKYASLHPVNSSFLIRTNYRRCPKDSCLLKYQELFFSSINKLSLLDHHLRQTYLAKQVVKFSKCSLKLPSSRNLPLHSLRLSHETHHKSISPVKTACTERKWCLTSRRLCFTSIRHPPF